jgi:hypothetical protein
LLSRGKNYSLSGKTIFRQILEETGSLVEKYRIKLVEEGKSFFGEMGIIDFS